MLLVLCLCSKNKKTIIVLKKQKHQPPNTKGFIEKKKSYQFNLMGWVITFKIILTYFLVAYKSEKKWDSTFLFFNKTGLWQLWNYEVTKLAKRISQCTSTSMKLKTRNFNTLIRFAILLSGDIQVNPGPDSNLCYSSGKRVSKRCLCCIKCNMKIHKNAIIWGYLKMAFAINVKRLLLSIETFQHYQKIYHSIM